MELKKVVEKQVYQPKEGISAYDTYRSQKLISAIAEEHHRIAGMADRGEAMLTLSGFAKYVRKYRKAGNE